MQISLKMKCIEDLVQNGERENIEFKEYLTNYHLKENRFQELACQMNHRILMGRGQALHPVEMEMIIAKKLLKLNILPFTLSYNAEDSFHFGRKST